MKSARIVRRWSNFRRIEVRDGCDLRRSGHQLRVISLVCLSTQSNNKETMLKTPAYATTKANAPLAPFTIERREPDPHDVLIDILYCGICHSDIHQVREEW